METIILFAPLLGALLCGFGWRLFGEAAAQWIATGLLFLAAILSWVVFLTFDGTTQSIPIFRFIESGTLSAEWAIRMDRLTAIMLIVITTVSALVHLYSFGYMAHDSAWKEGEHYKARFFAYLSFFTFAMLSLVTADNLVQMFFGWEGVGVASYLLIGFYYKKPSANAAAIKAFVVNRVGDFGFALGIFATYFIFDSIQFSQIFAEVPEKSDVVLTFLWGEWDAISVICALLFIGAMGKSAQLILHTWLPDAMEGPTPVSALIHAATMVTAGVFLVCRMSPMFEFAPGVLLFVAYLGAFTAFFAASVGLVQNDIKRVIAYSTCSQLGYMFAAAGVGAYPLAMYHLLTHAFFKALLFLCAGSVIHGMHHEQDMRNYGGLRHKMPYTFWAMMIGTFAITGVGIPLTHIGFAGFLSKDAIIEATYMAGRNYGTGVFWVLAVAAVMTAFYNWRSMFLTFFGEPRGDKHTHEHCHESPMTMLIPLGVLSVGAIFSGMVFFSAFFGHDDTVKPFFGIPYEAHAEDHGDNHAKADDHGDDHAKKDDGHGDYVKQKPGEGAVYFGPDNHVMHDAHDAPDWVTVSPFVAMLIGLGLSYWFYLVNPAIPGRLAANQEHLYKFLLNKWYFDEIYNFLFVKPAMAIGRFFWKRGDGTVIDGFLNGVAMGIIPFFTRLAGRLQSGYIFTYAFWMVIGIAALITWMSLGGAN
jgi:NADH-quinone oxidoreductase subunit L